MNEKIYKTIIKKIYDIPAPGIKGYIKDVSFIKLDDKNMLVAFDVEMKAMEGLVLKEVYRLSPNGHFKLLQEAKYFDVFE